VKLRRILIVVGFALLVAVSLQPAATPQSQTVGRCVVTVPSQWGTFRGISQGYGLVFEDDAGTLRVVNQMPCGLDGPPNISLEVRRK